jgi:hypothetical protein
LAHSLSLIDVSLGHILRNTSLSLVALSSRQPSHTKEAISSSLVGLNGLDDRLSVYQVDGLGDAESGLSKAADSVRARYGKDTVRLVVASAGIVSRSLAELYAQLLQMLIDALSFVM